MTRFTLPVIALLLLSAPCDAFGQNALNQEEIDRLIKENEQLKAENRRLQKALQSSGRASAATAVVDLQRTYDSLREKIYVEAEFKTRDEAFDAEKKLRETKIKQIEDSLKDIPEGSTEFINVREQLDKAIGDHRVWLTIEAGKINRDRADWIKTIYGKMMKAIEEVSNEKGYDLVLFKIPPIDFTEVRSEDVVRTIQGRKVLWSIDEIDLTDQVIQKMNLAYASQPKN